MKIKPIAITPGEPAGIGPDIVLQYLAQQEMAETPITLIANKSLLLERAQQLQLDLDIEQLSIIDIPLPAQTIAGKLNPANAHYVLQCLEHACQGCINNTFSALVTGPVHKGIINDAGFAFQGHTEYFADKTNTDDVVMMLMNENLKVALATTHIPLSAVSQHINKTALTKTIQIIHRDLQRYFQLNHPRITVCGLNPHAGEQGHFGREEIDIISPVIQSLQKQGLSLLGPAPADTAFTPHALQQCDIVLAMYHDQALIPLKASGFGNSVNITLGLPFLRTSVDHGTALELAGTGKADFSSLKQAISLASALRKKK